MVWEELAGELALVGDALAEVDVPGEVWELVGDPALVGDVVTEVGVPWRMGPWT